MSQEPKKLSQILQEQIANLEKNLKNLEQKTEEWKKTTPEAPLSSTTSTHKHQAETQEHKSLEDLLSCPTCAEKLRVKLKPEITKEIKEKLKSKELVKCVNCGEIVNAKEEDCPTCHRKDASEW